MWQLIGKLPTAQALSLLKKYWSQFAIFIVTATGFWYLWSPPQPIPETYKPEVRQPDRSIVLERKPDPEANAAMLLPKGAKLQRKITITVQSKNPVQAISGSVTIEETTAKQAQSITSEPLIIPEDDKVQYECPPVTLDLALVRMPDETMRIVAKSEDGIILSALDVPVENATPAAVPKKWAAGVLADPFRQTLGVFVDRRFGWMQTGVELLQREPGRLPEQINVKAGIVF